MRTMLGAAAAAALLVPVCCAVQREDLSEAARALVPEGKGVALLLKDGERVEGTLVEENDTQVIVRVERGGGIAASKRIARSEIQSMGSADICPLFGARLLELRPDPRNSLDEQEYERRLRLFDEYLVKCRGSAGFERVAALRDALQAEFEKVQQGIAKVDGVWLTPVRAAVGRFNLLTRQIEELERREDFRRNEKVRDAHDMLLDRRREVARRLPALMQERIPILISRDHFDEAVAETDAFLRFWIDQVILSEGPAGAAFREMDFDYIVRMEKRIMEAYRRSRKEPETAPAGADDDMVYVPGGYFLMGEESARPGADTFPLRIVYVSPFVIDRYEVSNAQYRRFVEHVKSSGDSSMEHPDAPPLKKHDAEGWKTPALSGEDKPVVGIDWFDAYAYARWAGKRLPTEAEWEKAARGLDGRVYPWGDREPAKCAINVVPSRRMIAAEMDRQNPPQPVVPESGGCACIRREEPAAAPPPTKLPDETWDVSATLPRLAQMAREAEMFDWKEIYPSPYGCLHMGGNVSEWVHDWYADDAYMKMPLRDPQGPETGEVHVFRGGSYLTDNMREVRTTWRGQPGDARERAGVSRRGRPFIGLRCAKSIDLVRE